MSTYDRSCASVVDASCYKKRCVESGLSELNVEFEGSNGYVYSVKYHNGRVRLSVGSHAVDGSGHGETRSGCLSVKDWKLFRSVVCADLDQPGFPEMPAVSYVIQTILFFSVCVKRERGR